MATLKQKKAIAGMIAGKSARRAMRDAGYAPSTCHSIQITRHKGFSEYLSEVGLTDEQIAQTLKGHVGSPDKRVSIAALQLVMKSRGLLKNNVILEKSEAEDFDGIE